MAFVAGALTQVSVSAQSDSLTSAVATGGTSPYTYQWYRSLTSGFTPGGGNIISGATALTLNDTGLIPNTTYYYKVVATDTGNSNVTAESAQLAVTTVSNVQSQNQFALSPILGMIDLRFDYDTVAVQIASTQATALYAGSAVKIVDSADGVPKVVGCAANSDEVMGFINYDIKTVAFLAGASAEISMSGNVMYLYASGAIARGAQVSLNLAGGLGVVQSAAGHTGDRIVGWAYDKAAGAGSLIRVFLKTPSFTVV